jgi:tetratricopeptide (TPR) repeat protein
MMLPRFSVALSRYKAFLVLFSVLGLLAGNAYWTIKNFVAEAYCNTVTNSTLNRDQDPALEEIKKAVWWNRDNAKYWDKLAGKLWSLRNDREEPLSDEESHKKQMEIISALEEAVRLDPFDAQSQVLLGWEYSYLWQDPDYQKKWLTAADRSMNRAAYFAGDKDPRLHVTIGNYWVMRSKTLLPSDPQWKTAWANARRHYEKARNLEKTKALKDEIETFVWKFYPDEAMVRDLIFSHVPEG